MIIERLVAVFFDQFVASGPFQVGTNHLADQLLKAGLRLPAEFELRLARVAEQRLDLGGTVIAAVDPDNDLSGLQC